MKTMAALFMLVAMGGGARHLAPSAEATSVATRPAPLVRVYATQGSPESERTVAWLADRQITFARFEMCEHRSEVFPILQKLGKAATPVVVERREVRVAGFDRDALQRLFSAELAQR